ncbi:patatin-like phospholipase family protein [Aurantimonas sp. Leaf443]|uniref:patatin-like phospholipase family protein n=1 Tax=Aurantimonas sp. Leaf443 TaxID=1736378 RepID=UPI0006F68ADB|nr:patatin-like phospholipase family protein [Aurantimonas sp. Leaf443]KQT82736.1 hypothetical protein ASG48_14650 [Aurantimonas sp. Leaf443]
MLDRVFGRSDDVPPVPTLGAGKPPATVTTRAPRPPKHGVALALGGGAARGWAHIGVLRALDEAKIPISMIAGTSIGALVGGCYLAGKLDELESFARSLTRRGMMRFLDLRFGGGGLIGGMRLSKRLADSLGTIDIEDLTRPLVCVACEARHGHEVWLDSGSLILAMRASYALPGVFEPVVCGERRLLDGALVNPVPVNVCRVFEEPFVVAVNLHYDLFGRAAVMRLRAEGDTSRLRPAEPVMQPDGSKTPITRSEKLSISRSMVDAFNIIQDRISRARLAGDPPDLALQPRVRDIGLSEFFRAAEAIDLGYEATMTRIKEIERMMVSLSA